MTAPRSGNTTAPRPARPVAHMAGLAALATVPAAIAGGTPLIRFTKTCLDTLARVFRPLLPLDGVLHWAPVVVLGAGLAYAAARGVRRTRMLRHLLRETTLRRPQPGEVLHRLATRHRAHGQVRILHGPVSNPAFAAGLVRPRIYLAEPLTERLSEEELELILLHELHHCRRRDPLRAALILFLSDVFFWIPLVRAAAARALARLEFAADDSARVRGDLALAEVILRVAQLSTRRAAPGPGLVSTDVLEHRVERLLGTPSAGRIAPPSRRTRALSVGVLVALWLIALASRQTHRLHQTADRDRCPTTQRPTALATPAHDR